MLAQIAECKPARPATGTPQRLILVNPHSFRMGRGDRLDQVRALTQASDAELELVSGPADIARQLEKHDPGSDDLLVIIGGDGTLQATVSHLAEQSHESDFPRLLVLGGGRTNFTARDLGSHGRLLPLLRRALQTPESLQMETRRPLRLQLPGQPPLYGFFVAGALVDHVIRDCHRYRASGRGWLRTGHPSSAWRVLQLAMLGLIGRSEYRPPLMRVDAAGLGTVASPMRIVLLSSLLHSHGRLDPYADRGQGGLRLTAITSQAKGFWRSLPALLQGHFKDTMQVSQGYLSGRADMVQVEGLPSICLDGQEYTLDTRQVLQVTAGPSFGFLRP